MKALATSLLVLALGFLAIDAFQASPPAQVERAFATAGVVRLDLAAGEYSLRGSDLEAIRVSWRTRRPEDASRARADVHVQGTSATVRTFGPKDGFRVDIDVPRRVDLDVHLSAGELEIRGIDGNKNLSMWAGEASIEVGDGSLYRQVDASVRAGEIQARPFDIAKGGLFRSFSRQGRGPYTLRARIFAGELTLMR